MIYSMVRVLCIIFKAAGAIILATLVAIPTQGMTSAEVGQALANAVARAKTISPNSIIAIVDREGYVLAVRAVGAIPAGPNQPDLAIAQAVSKAGTAAFLSSNEHAFTSRTAGFIVQQHFPPEINFTPPGPLVGVNFSNLEFSDVNRFKHPLIGRDPAANNGTNGAAIPLTSLAGVPGGMPLYKDGNLIGGVGVTIDGTDILSGIQGLNQSYDISEDVALAGQTGFAPNSIILGSNVFIDGIRLAYVNSGTGAGIYRRAYYLGRPVPPFLTIAESPSVTFPAATLGGLVGEVRQPIIDDPNSAPLGVPRLTAAEVTDILSLAASRARITRAGIRLPPGKAAQVFITVVARPNVRGVAPQILGTFRTPDATIFSWDVAVQKARTALFFSDSARAFSTRTVGFLAQEFYPPGINSTLPGPFFGLQERFSSFPLGTNTLNGATVTIPPPPPNPELPNGITIFPGGFPLYRNGVLIGAIGVSGDGIDQDDIIAASGTVNYLPPTSIRADQMVLRGARLPYAKFPRNPSL